MTEPQAQLNIGADFKIAPPPGGEIYGHLDARDPITGAKKWEVRFPEPPLASLLSTGGNLVFVPDARGMAHAYDAESGDELWNDNDGTGHQGGIISYSVDGKQYIAVVTGGPAWSAKTTPRSSAALQEHGEGHRRAGRLHPRVVLSEPRFRLNRNRGLAFSSANHTGESKASPRRHAKTKRKIKCTGKKMKRRIGLCLVAGLASFVVCGCISVPAISANERRPTGRRRQGRANERSSQAFIANGCGWCHAAGGRKEVAAATDRRRPRRDFLINRIATGSPGRMPSFGQALQIEDIQAIIVYIRNLKP